MTANYDASILSSSYITFRFDRPVTIYIAYDAGTSTRSNWISAYSGSGVAVGPTDPFSPSLNLYSLSTNAGFINLDRKQGELKLSCDRGG